MIVLTGLPMRAITGYRLTVQRGARAGLVKQYGIGKRQAARSFANRLDLEYGAICASVQPIWADETTSPSAA